MICERIIVVEHIYDDVYRGIVFDVDEDTGAKSVYDILEGTRKSLPKLMQQRSEHDGNQWDYTCQAHWDFHLGQTKTIEAQVRRLIECREGDAPTMTKTEAAKFGRSVGWTIRWSSEWNEFQCFPKGTNTEHPSAYFTDDVQDAVNTVKEMSRADV